MDTVFSSLSAVAAGLPPDLPQRMAHQLLAKVRSGLIVADQTEVLYANPAAALMFGRTVHSLLGLTVESLLAASAHGPAMEPLQRRLAGGPTSPCDVRCRRGNGSEFEARVWGQPLVFGGRRATLVTLIDISELHEALRQAEWRSGMLAHSEALCRSASLEVNLGTGMVTVSSGMRALLGEPDAVDEVGTVPLRLDQLDWIPPFERSLVAGFWRDAKVGEPFEFQHAVQGVDGQQLLVLHRGVLQAPAHPGAPAIGVAILRDITAQRDAERRIEELANFDEITGLPNRGFLLQQVDATLHQARSVQGHCSLVSIEVPRITELVGSMGFGAGDALAMAMASRLSELLTADEKLARVGPAEFALLRCPADGPEPETRLRQRAATLCQALQAPVSLGAADILVSCRIGMAGFPAHAQDASALLAAAQSARLEATAAEPVALFQPEANARALHELRLETALRQALQRGELSLVYQPQVCLRTGAVVGVEALLRWRSAELGGVPPDQFIPIAERTGLIVAIGDWVLHQACLQAVQWRADGLPPVRIGVNVSAVQFQLGDVAASIRHALLATGADAHLLGVELTESALLHDGEHVADTLRALRATGIEVSLDDFGTGFSSLSRLSSLPIDLLKIDKAFVNDVTAAPESASITRSIIQLAHGLKIPVIAEGVETEGQLNMLVANGCDFMQGYFFSKPVPAAAVADLLRAGQGLASYLLPRPTRVRTLLLVDDESAVLAALKRLFRRDGYRLLQASGGAEALELLATTAVDVILSDQRMPGMTGVDFLRRAKALHPHTIRMTLSGYTDLQSIIDAVNEGAVYKFLTKPWDDERLRAHVLQAFQQKELADDNRRLQHEVATGHAELAAVNQRLAQTLDRQLARSDLVQAGANGARDLVDALPAAVFGLDADGMLVYLNRPAADWLPEAGAWLGLAPGAALQGLLAALRAAPPGVAAAGLGLATAAGPVQAWLRPMADADPARGEVLVVLPVPPPADATGTMPSGGPHG